MPIPASATTRATPDEGLVRAIGLRALTLSVVNAMVGAGIFILPALVARRLGAAAVVAYVVCAAAMALVLLCFAESGSRVARSGGVYAYVETAFGPYFGFLVGNLLWFACGSLAAASVANALIGTLGEIWAPLGHGGPRVAIITALYAGLAWANVRGVRSGVGIVQGLTLAKLAPLLVLAAVGALAVRGENLAWPGMPAASRVGETALVLIYIFAGTEIALTPSGEVHDPARTVPRAVLGALAAATLLYLVLQFVAQGVLGPELPANDKAPLAMVAQRTLGEGGRYLMLAGAAISTFGYVSGDALGTPRVLFAFGRDGFLPSIVGAVHPRYHTPYVAIVLYTAITCLFAITGQFESLLILSNVGLLVMYFICCLATIALRRRGVRMERPPLNLPGGPVVPLLACGVVLWLLSSATLRELLAVAAMLAVATVLYLVRRRRVAAIRAGEPS